MSIGGRTNHFHTRGNVCVTEEECKAQTESDTKVIEFRTVEGPNLPKGCFYKNGVIYWGKGGTAEDISKTKLPGIQERLYCSDDSNVEIGSSDVNEFAMDSENGDGKGTQTAGMTKASLAQPLTTDKVGDMTGSVARTHFKTGAVVALFAAIAVGCVW